MKKKYLKSQFLADVAKEAKALKKNATKDELENLSINLLNPLSFNSCIYGQMTGYCNSTRALTLIQGCCPRFFTTDNINQGMSMTGVKKAVNGKKVGEFKNGRNRYYMSHFSAIETYILTKDAKNANLIAFLRDETKELNL